MALVITNQTLSGSEVSYTIPDDTASIAFQASGGAITMATTSGGDTWTIADGDKEALSNRSLVGQTLYFNGTATLQIRRETGLMC